MSEVSIVFTKFQSTIRHWKLELEKLSYLELCVKPDDESWSIGQVVLHIIEETNWYFEQIEKCIYSNENEEKTIKVEINEWFEQNEFPNKRFKGPPNLPNPVQPESKENLLDKWEKLSVKAFQISNSITDSHMQGKIAHPGHGYLNAKEWFQYAEMHMRHHFRQKERIYLYLTKSKEF